MDRRDHRLAIRVGRIRGVVEIDESDDRLLGLLLFFRKGADERAGIDFRIIQREGCARVVLIRKTKGHGGDRRKSRRGQLTRRDGSRLIGNGERNALRRLGIKYGNGVEGSGGKRQSLDGDGRAFFGVRVGGGAGQRLRPCKVERKLKARCRVARKFKPQIADVLPFDTETEVRTDIAVLAVDGIRHLRRLAHLDHRKSVAVGRRGLQKTEASRLFRTVERIDGEGLLRVIILQNVRDLPVPYLGTRRDTETGDEDSRRNTRDQKLLHHFFHSILLVHPEGGVVYDFTHIL